MIQKILKSIIRGNETPDQIFEDLKILPTDKYNVMCILAALDEEGLISIDTKRKIKHRRKRLRADRKDIHLRITYEGRAEALE